MTDILNSPSWHSYACVSLGSVSGGVLLIVVFLSVPYYSVPGSTHLQKDPPFLCLSQHRGKLLLLASLESLDMFQTCFVEMFSPDLCAYISHYRGFTSAVFWGS